MTNDLIKRLQDSQGNKSLSLRERVTSLATRGEDNILLLDISGSMGEDINSEETKIDALWSIVQRLRSQGLSFKTAVFSSYPEWSDAITKPHPSGGTALAEALEFVATVHPRQVTIVTDGQPNDAQAALEEASKLRCKINVLFIGSAREAYAQEFCRQLALANNGTYSATELTSEQLQLAASQTARLMLTTGETGKGTIQL